MFLYLLDSGWVNASCILQIHNIDPEDKHAPGLHPVTFRVGTDLQTGYATARHVSQLLNGRKRVPIKPARENAT